MTRKSFTVSESMFVAFDTRFFATDAITLYRNLLASHPHLYGRPQIS